MARFPRDDGRRKQWLAKIKREGEPTDSARICEVNYIVYSLAILILYNLLISTSSETEKQ